ncbi:MAG: hypothetical protein ACYC4D_09765 [Thermoleophilia bacterium]
MLNKLTIIVMVAGLLLGSSGVALAATGQLPGAADEVATLFQGAVDEVATLVGIQDEDLGAFDNRDRGRHDEEEFLVAKDEIALRTVTLPDGEVIDEEVIDKMIDDFGLAGQAIREMAAAARQLGNVVRQEMEQRPAHEAFGIDQRQPENTPPAPPAPPAGEENYYDGCGTYDECVSEYAPGSQNYVPEHTIPDSGWGGPMPSDNLGGSMTDSGWGGRR